MTAAIHHRIRGLRTSLALSQARLAALVGVSQATVNRWEHGDRVPDGEALTRFREALGVDPAWLLTGEGIAPAGYSSDPASSGGTDDIPTSDRGVGDVGTAYNDELRARVRELGGLAAASAHAGVTPRALSEALAGARDLGSAALRELGVREPTAAYRATPDVVMVPILNARARAGDGREMEDGVGGFWPVMRSTVRRGVNVERLAVLRVEGDSMEPTLRDGDVVMLDRDAVARPSDGVWVIEINGHLSVKRLAFHVDGVEIISDNAEKYRPRMVAAGEEPERMLVGRVIYKMSEV